MNVYPYCWDYLLPFVACALNMEHMVAVWSKIIVVGLSTTILTPSGVDQPPRTYGGVKQLL